MNMRDRLVLFYLEKQFSNFNHRAKITKIKDLI